MPQKNTVISTGQLETVKSSLAEAQVVEESITLHEKRAVALVNKNETKLLQHVQNHKGVLIRMKNALEGIKEALISDSYTRWQCNQRNEVQMKLENVSKRIVLEK